MSHTQGMIGGVSFQMGNCQSCGIPLYGNGFHQCQPLDPRITKEFAEIKAMLQRVLNIVETD